MKRTPGNTLDTVLTIGDRRALVTHAPNTNMLRGEFLDLNGGADFSANDIATLKIEGAKSLSTFLRACRENGIEPFSRAL